jgi:hypothetical protein
LNLFPNNGQNAINEQEALNVPVNYVQQDSDKFNILTTLEDTYFVIGTGQKTIRSVNFSTVPYQDIQAIDLEYEHIGDGTVPYVSATVLGQITKLGEGRYTTVKCDHGQTVKDDEALFWIGKVLDNSQEKTAPLAPFGKSYTVIRIACPVEVRIEKGTNTLSSFEEDFSELAIFGRLDLIGSDGDEIKMLCIDDGDFALTLQGTAEGAMDYEIRWFNEDNNLIDKKTFSEVPITIDTKISTDTNKTNTVLNIDKNGDGKVDQIVTPDGTQSAKWWTNLPNWVQWILRWVFFGWIWM